MGSGLSKEQASLPFAYVRIEPSPADATEAGVKPTPSHEPPVLSDTASLNETITSRQRSLSTSTPPRPAPITHSYSLNDLDAILSGRGRFRAGTLGPSDRPAIGFGVEMSDGDQDFETEVEDEEEWDAYGRRAPQRAEDEHDATLKPITFGQLTSLATIGLCTQSLIKVSPNIGLLQTTTTLQLCCNDLSYIPPEIGHMKNLTHLSVARNRITHLPDTIGYLTKLVELKASENLLTTLPSSIRTLTKLTALHLEQNRLTSLPAEIGHLKNLAILDISDNALITTVPAEVGRLKFLRRLRIDNCPNLLTSFPSGPFTATPPSLKELAARVIVRHQLPILSITQEPVKQYLSSAHTCSFCGGPYFESYASRGKMVERQPDSPKIPMEYRLCVPHWGTDEERVSMMFCPLPDTAPTSPYATPKASPLASPVMSRRRGGPLSTSSSSSSLSSLRQAASSSATTNPLPHLSNVTADGTLRTSSSSSSSVPLSSSIPLSALTKSPSLPSLPVAALEGRSFKKRLLEKGGLKPKRAISYGVVG
ncbi:Leucine-rich repeat-containing protein 63 [Rhizophlyctis rosea]|nr:Leucine-rich repeat-containing protein 63 [Rhizophlyctis rosea]